MTPIIHRFEPISYSDAIRLAFEHLLATESECFCIGQGLWSPWYVGNTMVDLEKKFGVERIIDTPVSELGVTGLAIGAGLSGFKPIVVHPRMDFMLLAVDQIVNQAAKWRHMLGGRVSTNVTIRGIINRGGEQGAQHSQALQSWFAHIPGLRVLMPATPKDAFQMLVAAVNCADPVIYIDDRWCYDLKGSVDINETKTIEDFQPEVVKEGQDVTLVASSFSTRLALEASEKLEQIGISAEVIDLRQINPLVSDNIVTSVKKTGRLLAIDGGWAPCGISAEVLAIVGENVDPQHMRSKGMRLTIPFAPAPSARSLEKNYYTSCEDVIGSVLRLLKGE